MAPASRSKARQSSIRTACGEDAAFETRKRELGQKAAMVDMSVGQDYSIYAFGVERERLVVERLQRLRALETGRNRQAWRLDAFQQEAGSGHASAAPKKESLTAMRRTSN